jgi:hypothetical protein
MITTGDYPTLKVHLPVGGKKVQLIHTSIVHLTTEALGLGSDLANCHKILSRISISNTGGETG